MTNPTPPTDPYAKQRLAMVRDQIQARGVKDPAVLAAMRRVLRHAFVPSDAVERAYADAPLPIGQGQTISQPYMVARMTELAGARPGIKVLDVGTGSGYQAAVLAELVDRVYSIEVLEPMADAARERLADLGYANIEVHCGDGNLGWEEHAPYDAIVVAAAPEAVPPALVEQLGPGGRLVIPVGEQGGEQKLLVLTKSTDGAIWREVQGHVRFVPLI